MTWMVSFILIIINIIHELNSRIMPTADCLLMSSFIVCDFLLFVSRRVVSHRRQTNAHIYMFIAQ